MPRGIRSLPIDERGYPVPWFVQWFDAQGGATNPRIGKPDFRIADGRKRNAAVQHGLCWICGMRLGKVFAFVVGPMCAVNRVSGDPPMHRTCAEFSVLACPFLTRPKAERRDAGLPEGGEVPGFGIMRNPGVSLVWITDSYRPVDDGKGSFVIHMGPPRGRLWFAEDRAATRAEVLASFESGLPILEAAAAEEGPDAVRQLQAQTAEALRLLPA